MKKKSYSTEQSKDDKMAKEFRDKSILLIDYIAAYYEEPANWPLSPQEQSNAIRVIFHKVRQLKASECSLHAVAIKLHEDLSLAS